MGEGYTGQKKVAVVILNWNGKKFLEQFLPSLVQNSKYDNTSIFIADNGSTDESVSYLKENYPGINLILLDRNYGFTGGYNKALEQIDSQYYVLINSDVEVTENWLLPIIDLMDAHPDIAACQPKILSYSQKEYFEYAGAAGGFIDKYGYPFCRGRILKEHEIDKGQYNGVSEIFWATGACMFVRAELFRLAGGFDEDFFAHMEEIDLCWRFKNMGYKIYYNSASTVYHVGGGTLPNNNPQKLYLNYRNNLFLLFKNLPSKQRFKIVFVRMLLDGASAFVYLFSGSFTFYWAVLRAHIRFYLSINKMKIKRAKMNNIYNSFEHNQVYKGSIVKAFFVKKIRKFSDLIAFPEKKK